MLRYAVVLMVLSIAALAVPTSDGTSCPPHPSDCQKVVPASVTSSSAGVFFSVGGLLGSAHAQLDVDGKEAFTSDEPARPGEFARAVFLLRSDGLGGGERDVNVTILLDEDPEHATWTGTRQRDIEVNRNNSDTKQIRFTFQVSRDFPGPQADLPFQVMAGGELVDSAIPVPVGKCSGIECFSARTLAIIIGVAVVIVAYGGFEIYRRSSR